MPGDGQKPVRVVLSGASGRMGRSLATLIAADEDFTLVGGIGHAPAESAGAPADLPCPLVPTPTAALDLLRQADVVIDFSAPELLRALLTDAADALAGKALVVGTTGLDDAARRALDDAARRAAVLQAANFSVGVNLLLALAERAAVVLGPDYDVEIVEAHHRRKVDAPSGTALALGEAVALGRGVELDAVRSDGRTGRPGERVRGEIGFHALRGGDIVGEHRLLLIGEREQVELAHVARARALFADGALRAARWLAGKPVGAYTMRDVLGLG